jgi:hypothetical protein
VVRLTNAPTEKALKEVAALLRAVTGSPYLSSNIAQSTIAITGTPEQLALAEWLAKAIDKPAGWRPSDSEYGNPAAREYKLPSGPEEVARVFYLRDTATPQAVQEILTIVRTVLDVQKLFFRSEPKMLAYRTDPSMADLIEWLLPKLDSQSGDPSHTSDSFKLPTPARDGSDDVVNGSAHHGVYPEDVRDRFATGAGGAREPGATFGTRAGDLCVCAVRPEKPPGLAAAGKIAHPTF